MGVLPATSKPQAPSRRRSGESRVMEDRDTSACGKQRMCRPLVGRNRMCHNAERRGPRGGAGGALVIRAVSEAILTAPGCTGIDGGTVEFRPGHVQETAAREARVVSFGEVLRAPKRLAGL